MKRPLNPLDSDQTSRLLGLAIRDARPIDVLVDYLEGEGPDAFVELLGQSPLEGDELRGSLLRGEKSCRWLQDRKEACKRTANNEDASSFYGSLLAYFLCIAAAKLHHARNICSRPKGELENALLDLASVVPAPWSEFLEQAATPRVSLG